MTSLLKYLMLQEITFDASKPNPWAKNREKRVRERDEHLKSGEKIPIKANDTMRQMKNNSTGINRAAATNTPIVNGKDHSKSISDLDNEFHGHKTDKHMVLYHGLRTTRLDNFVSAKNKAKKAGAKHFDYPVDTYHSTSTEATEAGHRTTSHPNEEHHAHILAIHTPKGSHAINLHRDFKSDNEKEVLLHRHSKISVSNKPITIKKGNYHTHIWPAKLVHDGIKEIE